MRAYLTETDYARRMDETVLPYLAARRQDRTLAGYDGVGLFCSCFSADEPRGTVTVVHGFTEFIEKYRELIWVFLSDGLNVVVYEQRGHGRSHRDVADKKLTHVNRFTDYVKDLDRVLAQTADFRTGPQYLFSHSMGGAVSALFLEERPAVFARAVLSSPMIAPARGGLPAWATRAGFKFFLGLRLDRRRMITPAGAADGPVPVRAAYFESLKQSSPDFQNAHPTHRWGYEAQMVTGKVLAPGKPEAVVTPVLLFSAGRDGVVLPEPQQELARRLPDCTLKTIPDAAHEIFAMGDAILHPYLDDVLDFFR
ncbi:MAG: alpha/beta hydrolase [Oscillospiraceae bacterium]|nr:alpha/beta hydrolase [Oscillospiraceae bacterium]